MSTELQVYDEKVMVGAGIPTYSMACVELGWGSQVVTDESADRYYMWIDHLMRPGSGTGVEHQRRPQSNVEGLRNAKFHRLEALLPMTLAMRILQLITCIGLQSGLAILSQRTQ